MKKIEDQYFEVKDQLYSINYLYYGLYFIFLVGLQVFHTLLFSFPTALVQAAYVLYAVGETFIEVLFLAFISGWLLQKGCKKLNQIFTFSTLVLFLLHALDFPLQRLMDISVWFGLSFAIQEARTSFIEVLHASTIPLRHWLLAAGASLCFFCLGMWLVHVSEKVVRKKLLLCSSRKIFGLFVMSCFFLVSGEVALFLQTDVKLSGAYAQVLPWKRTLLPIQEEIISVGSYLCNESERGDLSFGADSNFFSLERNPDIFIFITESLREDYITKEVAPHLYQFSQEYASFPNVLSIANATQVSWFSTFYSLFPFYWTKYQPRSWQSGSPALQLFKKMGYKIHAYSATRLSFYSMRQVLFGKGDALADEVVDVQGGEMMAPYQADAQVFENLYHRLHSDEKKGGRLFILFLDSTHFDYSWPKEQGSLFSPIEENMSYLKLSYNRKEMHKITNRYKNAIHYVDSLFCSFKERLQKADLWEDSVVVFTGDHAESFDEDGRMFHASSLSLPQLKIPLYMKLGADSQGLDQNRVTSQVDIFPTLFHYLLEENSAEKFFHGKSLLEKKEAPYILGARYNRGEAPYQFYIYNGNYRAVLEFCNPSDIFHCNQLKVCSIEDREGRKVPFSFSFIQEEFQDALEALFPRHGS